MLPVDKSQKFPPCAVEVTLCVRRKQICDRRLVCGSFDDRSLMHGWQKTGVPVTGPARREATHVRQHHKRRQIVRFTSKSVSDPRSHAGKSRTNEATVHHEHCRPVQSRLILHRVDKGHVVHVSAHQRKQVTQPATAFPVLAKSPEALRIRSRNSGERLLAKFRVEGCSMSPFQFRPVVPRIHVTHAARTEDLDDAVCGWTMVTPARQCR